MSVSFQHPISSTVSESKEDEISSVWFDSKKASLPTSKSSFYLVPEGDDTTTAPPPTRQRASSTANMSFMDRIFHYFNREDDNFEYRKNSMGMRLKFVYLFYFLMVGSLGFIYIDGVTQTRFVFYVLIGAEFILNSLVIRNIERNIPMAKKEALNMFMTLFSCANRIVLQVSIFDYIRRV
ncbi:predicted protein [Naegleria gruberi]|uniref:Predicted protein n=1 Tax=Naegleria gruberi TaxID=5762 RepID=D2VU89_NAEGR|nr:uncharacterized protein NAEGRDRAFT_81243 [Naegleria gruberi]EFC39586.1 predicted protein [Naegleria gruberi]|eukprot:XP_002672330.1 predicted protein [Naegleria gruberi strain NEG-M]